jgi:hypothetical protein
VRQAHIHREAIAVFHEEVASEGQLRLAARVKLKLPRFGGHLPCFLERCPDAENPPTVCS